MSAAVAYPSSPLNLSPDRPDTQERWDRALERAKVANVQLTHYEPSDTWFVTSASHPGVRYESDGYGCTCEAYAHGDPVCLHRAAVRDHLAERAKLGLELLDLNEQLRKNWDVLYRYNTALERDGYLSARGFDALERAGDRDRDLHRRIREIEALLNPEPVAAAA